MTIHEIEKLQGYAHRVAVETDLNDTQAIREELRYCAVALVEIARETRSLYIAFSGLAVSPNKTWTKKVCGMGRLG